MPRLGTLGSGGAKGYGFTQGISAAAPVNTVAPVNSFTSPAKVRDVCTTNTGTWTSPGGSSLSYAYQWCYGTTGSPTLISGATSNSFTITTAETGQTVFCRVTATNAIGSTAAFTNLTGNVQPNVPLAPTIGTATATGATTATVAYTAPSSNGGSTITSYRATSSPGGITGTLSTAGSGTITVSGLSAGTSYTFIVQALNGIGYSANSGSSNSITTTAIAPTNATAPVVSGTPQVTFYYPSTDGTWNNSPTSYSYQWYNAGTNTPIAGQTQYRFNPGTDATYTGITLKCQVTATNSAGSASAFSNTSPAVIASVPGQPTSGTATATGSTTATATYTASYNGGATITRFDAYTNTGVLVGTLATSGSGTIPITGLSPATTYSFEIKAVNSAGSSIASFPRTNAITTNAPTMSVALAGGSSPYVSAYPWTDATGFGARFSNPTPTGVSASTVQFNAAGTYVVASAFAGNNFDIWAWSHSTGFGTRSSAPATLPSNYGYSANFSRQGTSVAVGTSTTPFIQIYPFSAGTIGAKFANPSTLPAIGSITNLAFSPAGTEILMVGDTTSPYNAVYSFTAGTGFGAKLTSPTFGNQARDVAFTATGPTVAVAGWMSGSTYTAPWSSSGFGSQYSSPSTSISSLGFSSGWDPAGQNVAFGSFSSPFIQVYQFASGFGTKYTNPATLPPSTVNSVSFSGTGNSIALGHANTPFVSGYPFSKAQSPTFGSGFGTKFSNPATLPPAAITGISIGST